MIRTALLALALALSATAVHAAEPKGTNDRAVQQQERACHPIFVTCPNDPSAQRGLTVQDKDFAPTPLRDARKTVFA